MFITRKQYERELRRAKTEGRKEAIKEAQLHDRMNSIEGNLCNSLDRLRRRVDDQLEAVRAWHCSCGTLNTTEKE